MFKTIQILIIFSFLNLFFSVGAQAENLGMFEQFQKSSLILKAQVKSIENFNGRPDWQVVSIGPKQVYKGVVNSELRFFHLHYFSSGSSIYTAEREILVFLKPLSSFTSYEPLKQAGVQFEVLSDESLIIGNEDKTSYEAWLNKYNSLAALFSDPSKKNILFESLYLSFFNPSYSTSLQQALSQDLVMNSLHFEYASILGQLKQKILDYSVSESARLKLLDLILKLPQEKSNIVLKEFFCISPISLCLKTAQALEERGQKIEIQNYKKIFEKADSQLKLGLLSVLGKAKRVESLDLFSAYLKTEKDPKNIAQALEALSGLASSKKAFTLMMSFANYPQIDVRIAFAGSVGEFGKDEALPVLEKILKSRDPALVVQTANSLQKIGSAKSLTLLYKYYEKGHHGHWEPKGFEQKHEHFIPKAK